MQRAVVGFLSVVALAGLLGGCTLFGVSYDSETTEVRDSSGLESRVDALERRILALERKLGERR